MGTPESVRRAKQVPKERSGRRALTPPLMMDTPDEVYILSREYNYAGMLSVRRERGLSEIVGFILILATIVVAIAVYSNYGIPAQGREGEIQHMDQVKDRFVEFKINLDSLWSNRQCGTAIGTSFSLGTGSAATTGFLSIIPLLAPVGSSATLALNQRAEYINITMDSYLMVDSGGVNDSAVIQTVAPATTPITFSTTPRYFFINITSPDLLKKHGIHVQPASGSDWEAWVNLTPAYTFSRRFSITNGTSQWDWYKIYSFSEWNEARWNHTDVTVSTWKGGIPVVQDLGVVSNATYPANYIVDLMNPAYGISGSLGSTQSLTATRSDYTIVGSYLTNYSYWPTVQVGSPQLMGSLEYDAQNKYWVNQHYYYQMGGIFLEQDEGNTVKVPPAISFSTTADGFPVVNINEIFLTSPSAIIQGSGPVQVTSSVTGITGTQMVAGNNTRSVNISITAQSANAALAWQQALQNAATTAGFSSTIYTSNAAGTVGFLNVCPSSRIYGVQLSLNTVTVNSALQSAAPSSGG